MRKWDERKRKYPWARKWYRGSRWRQLRARVLAEQPRCGRCGALSTVADHIRAHKGREELFFDRQNLQGLCQPCHDGWKASMEAGTVDSACSDAGVPLDDRHPWNQK